MLDYHGLVSLSSVMTVTETEGNLVNTLDQRNPTQLLLSAIREHNLTVTSLKTEEEFYLMTEDTQIVSICCFLWSSVLLIHFGRHTP